MKRRATPLQIIVHLAGWLPLALLLYDFFANNLTANPIQDIEQRSGRTALSFLVASLACTPISTFFGWREWLKRRKALGNYGFLYALLHVMTFFLIDYGLDLRSIWRDVNNKPYILIGAIAFLLLLPLAVTSFNYWMKKLGKNWKRLHRLVYLISPLVLAHFFLAVKGNLSTLQGNLLQPLLYSIVVHVLLLVRIPKVKMALLRLRGDFNSRSHATTGASAKEE